MWNLLETQEDIDNLIRVFGGFHDSCIKQVFIRSREFVDERLTMPFDNTPMIRLFFQRQADIIPSIEIQFDEVKYFNWKYDDLTYDTGLSIIYEAVLEQRDHLIYWAEDIDWREKDADKDEFRWLAAVQAKWRIVADGLGESDKPFDFKSE